MAESEQSKALRGLVVRWRERAEKAEKATERLKQHRIDSSAGGVGVVDGGLWEDRALEAEARAEKAEAELAEITASLQGESDDNFECAVRATATIARVREWANDRSDTDGECTFNVNLDMNQDGYAKGGHQKARREVRTLLEAPK